MKTAIQQYTNNDTHQSLKILKCRWNTFNECPGGTSGKEPSCQCRRQKGCGFHPWITHCSVLAWRIPGTGEPGGLPSMGSNRVGHDWSDLAAAAVGNCPFFMSFLVKIRWVDIVSINPQHNSWYLRWAWSLTIGRTPFIPGSRDTQTIKNKQAEIG